MAKVWTTKKVEQVIHDLREGSDHEPDTSCFYMGDVQLRNGNITFEYTPEEQEELVRCANDVVYFANKFCYAMTDEGIANIHLRPYQENMLSKFQDHRYVIMMASRQIGKTITSSIFLAWYACFHFDRNVLVIANKMATTVEIVDKIKTVIKNLPFFLKPGTMSAGATGMKFDNNVRLFSQATTKTAAIGFTIHLLYADEFAHIPDNFIEDFWRSIYPTLASSKISRIIISSTPNQMNLFWKIYSRALERKNEFEALRVDWWEVPGRDDEWKEKEIANLGSIELFNQEYGNQFLSSSSMLLSSRILTYVERISHIFEEQEIYDLEYSEADLKGLKWHKDFDPNRINENDRFVFAVDIGDGVGRDYSVINILRLDVNSTAMIRKMKKYDNEVDFFRLVQVGLFRSNILSVEQFSKVAEELLFNLFNYERVRVVVEINFKGHLFYDRLSRHIDFYPEIFLHSQHTQTSLIWKPGIKIKKDNREIYIRELRNMIQNKRIVVQDDHTFRELSSFGLTKNGKYEAQTGNDDVAMSIVLLVPYFDNISFYEDVEEVMENKSDSILEMINTKMNDLPEDVVAGKDSVTWMKYLNNNWGSNVEGDKSDPFKRKGKKKDDDNKFPTDPFLKGNL